MLPVLKPIGQHVGIYFIVFGMSFCIGLPNFIQVRPLPKAQL